MMPPAEHIGGKVQMADVREENFKTGNYRCTNHEFPAPSHIFVKIHKNARTTLKAVIQFFANIFGLEFFI